MTPKKTWNLIRSVLPTNADAATSILDHFEAECDTIEPRTVTNCFNNFFCSIGKLMHSNLDDRSFSNYLSNRVSTSLYLNTPSVSEIINVINSLNVDKAVGHDNIPAFFVRIAATIISPYLQYYIDFFFKKGIFSESYTLAKVIPLYKKGNKLDPNNYRPISILTCFSKILERIIYNRLQEFLKKHSVIHKSQYSFQKNISNKYAVLDIVSNAFENINQNLFTGLIFFYLRYAFNTASHSVLLSELDHYGISGPANQLINFFSNRRQYVSVNGTNSDIKLITNGVAQGSTLGPILFLLYINDLYNSTNCLPRLFADDTCLVLHSLDPNNLERTMNNELRNVSEWCHANKLSLNPSKSNFLLIPPRLRKPPPNISLKLNNVEINPCENVKYLGVQIDSQLTFNSHIRMIENKISRSIGIIIKLKSLLPPQLCLNCIMH